MANFFATTFLSLILAASGAALTAEQSLIRRDGPKMLTIDPSGALAAMVEEGKESDTNTIVPEGCNDVFPYGVADSDSCGNFTVIEDDGKCREAAAAMNRTYPRTAVLEGEEWETVRPKGCFEFPCQEDSNEKCLFYNERDLTTAAKKISGVPVCLKEKYVNGTAAPGEKTSCPAGYENMEGEFAEDTCRTAGICKGYCDGHQFRSELAHTNASEVFPQGCFIHAKWGCLYYNNVTSTPPSNPTGTPVCKAVEASGAAGATVSPSAPMTAAAAAPAATTNATAPTAAAPTAAAATA